MLEKETLAAGREHQEVVRRANHREAVSEACTATTRIDHAYVREDDAICVKGSAKGRAEERRKEDSGVEEWEEGVRARVSRSVGGG